MRALLANARRVQAYVSARLALRVPLPLPGLINAERNLLSQKLLQTRARIFGHALDGRFTHFEAAQFLQSDFARLLETVLHAGDADDFPGRRAERSLV